MAAAGRRRCPAAVPGVQGRAPPAELRPALWPRQPRTRWLSPKPAIKRRAPPALLPSRGHGRRTTADIFSTDPGAAAAAAPSSVSDAAAAGDALDVGGGAVGDGGGGAAVGVSSGLREPVRRREREGEEAGVGGGADAAPYLGLPLLLRHAVPALVLTSESTAALHFAQALYIDNKKQSWICILILMYQISCSWGENNLRAESYSLSHQLADPTNTTEMTG